MGGLRSAWSFVYEHTLGWAFTKIGVSVTVEDTEHWDAYVWLSKWLDTHLRRRRVNSLLLRPFRDDIPDPPAFDVIPEYGTYYFTYGKRLVVVDHQKAEQSAERYSRSTHSIRLRIWLSRDRQRIVDVVEQARVAYERSRPKRVDYYRWDGFSDWVGATVPGRPVTCLFHRPDMVEDLFADIRAFLASKQVYRDLGIPYRRGYLLTGPPGTGKSSLILAVASHFELPVYSVPLHGSDINGERVAALLANCRKRSIIAIEDVDCLQVATSRKSKTTDGLTLADLLNAIDGIGASEDRLLFMTANRPEALDPALTRAGRVDRKFFIDYARDEELRCFYERMAQYFRIQPWPEFRASLPTHATIADAQALAVRGECVDTEHARCFAEV